MESHHHTIFLLGNRSELATLLPSFTQSDRHVLEGTALRFIVSLLLVVLAGCGSDDSPVLVRLGDNQITAADLERFVARLPKTIRSTEKGREANLDHLNSAIDHQMLIVEARARGLHEAEAFVYDLRQTIQGRLAHALWYMARSGLVRRWAEGYRALSVRFSAGVLASARVFW